MTDAELEAHVAELRKLSTTPTQMTAAITASTGKKKSQPKQVSTNDLLASLGL